MNGNDIIDIGIFETKYCLRKYMFLDGNNRIIDVRKYKEKAIEICLDNDYLNYGRYRNAINKRVTKKRQRRKHHSGYFYYHNGLKGVRTR